jgi:LysM repeat protein
VLLAVAAAVALIISSGPARHSATHGTLAGVQHRTPPYYTVKPGDTFAQISVRTGLSVEQLQSYNPSINPLGLTPGERLNLWRYPPKPPKPKPKLPGPMFWTVQSGQSFGSIAASTGINITTLEQLNPNLKPSTLQPGDRVRLRH